MNIIGSGQIASSFFNLKLDGNICLFASGVSDSLCVDGDSFLREEILLKETLCKYKKHKFAYFSSSALSAIEGYDFSPYYMHKRRMETIVLSLADRPYIFRLPQLFGAPLKHKTLINFLFNSIKNGENFSLYDGSHRYVIYIDDLTNFVAKYLSGDQYGIIDVANPYRYSVIELVRVIELALGVSARFNIVKKEDKYLLDFGKMKEFLKKSNLNFDFGEDYFQKKFNLYLSKKN